MFLTPTMHEKLPSYIQQLLDLSDLSDVALEQHAKITIDHLLVSFSLLEMGHAVAHEMTQDQCVSILEILDAKQVGSGSDASMISL